jgi:hypothetical protein
MTKLSSLVLVRPVQCPGCQGLSYVPLRYGVFALFTWVVLSWLFIATALFFRNVLYLLGTIPAAIFAVDKWMLKAPLVKLTD